MRTIDANVQISEDHSLSVSLPVLKEYQPGTYHALIVLDDAPQSAPAAIKHQSFRLNVLDLQAWPADCTFRREVLYE